MWQLFWKFSKKFSWPCCLGLLKNNKIAALVTSLCHDLIVMNKVCYVALPFTQYKQWILYDKLVIAKGEIKNTNILMYIIMLL
jgi:hypothetical protein